MAARSRIALLGPALALFLWPVHQSSAQEPQGAERAAQEEGTPAPEVRAQRGSPGKAGEVPQAAAAAADQGLRQRVEQLEEQLVDLQVVIGTLELLARSGGARLPQTSGPGSGAGAGGSDQARLEGIETQIRALTAQLEQLSNEVRGQGGAARRTDAGGLPPAEALPDAGGTPPAGTSRFGSTTVTSGSSDPIGAIISNGPPGASEGAVPAAGPGRVAMTEPPTETFGGNPKQIYERAYGYLLQKNYSAAQAGFGDFLKRYPKDPQAPDALYWLGEAHYVQRNYADAAEAFDLVTASFSGSAKAPDAQLKRAMSLAQLGKKQDACTAFRELGTKYPSAPPYVKSKADSERQRTGCP